LARHTDFFFGGGDECAVRLSRRKNTAGR
jgi:hypothetical protein